MKKLRPLQDIFDEVTHHLFTQGVAARDVSINKTGYACKYRDSRGNKCAVGCLIPPEVYSPDLEGQTLTNDAVKDALPFMVDKRTQDLLSDLMIVHDEYSSIYWKDELRGLAHGYGLEWRFEREEVAHG